MVKAYIALIVVYISWSTTFLGIHYALDTLPAPVLACQRFLFAGLLLLAFCLLRGEKLPGWNGWLRNGMVGFFMYVTGNAVTCWVLQTLPTGLTSAIVAINPVWLTALAMAIPPRENVPLATWGGIALSIIGLLILLSPELKPAALSDGELGYMLVVVLMGFSWSLGSILAKKTEPHCSLIMGVAMQTFIAGLVLVPVCLMTGYNPFFIGSPMSMAAEFYLIFVGTMIGMSCYLYTLDRLPVTISSTFAYVTPVITALLGHWFLGEAIPPTMVAGMLVIFMGIALIQKLSYNNNKAVVEALDS